MRDYIRDYAKLQEGPVSIVKASSKRLITTVDHMVDGLRSFCATL